MCVCVDESEFVKVHL